MTTASLLLYDCETPEKRVSKHYSLICTNSSAPKHLVARCTWLECVSCSVHVHLVSIWLPMIFLPNAMRGCTFTACLSIKPRHHADMRIKPDNRKVSGHFHVRSVPGMVPPVPQEHPGHPSKNAPPVPKDRAVCKSQVAGHCKLVNKPTRFQF
jgi:hypothetical protein